MTRLLFGDKNVGVQGIYYFDTREEAMKIAPKMKPFLDSLRHGTDYWKELMEEWKHEKLIYNFLCECKSRVEAEDKTPEVWWEPGGIYYGEEWLNKNLPNGIGTMYCGDQVVEDEPVEAGKQDEPWLNIIRNFHPAYIRNLIDLHEPTEPVPKFSADMTGRGYVCGSCRRILRRGDRFCSSCGQKVNWSKIEKKKEK